MANPVIAIKGITKQFGNFSALDNLSLEINENRCLGFLGPNGAGKTTLIKILTGLIKPNAGTIYIDGIDVSKNSTTVLSKIGAVVETPEFYSYLTPYDVLSFFGKLRGIPKKTLDEKINSTLELVGLEKWSRKKIGKFSKGMKQRLALASALIHEPPILILDEPTTGLDPRGSVEIREIINSLKKSGKTIFFSSHLLNEVQETCDEIALIDKGKLIRQAEISDFGGKLTKIEIATLKPIDDYEMKLILKIEGVESAKLEGDKFTISISGDKQRRANLLKELQKIGLEIISFKPSSDLESLYMDNISESVR